MAEFNYDAYLAREIARHTDTKDPQGETEIGFDFEDKYGFGYIAGTAIVDLSTGTATVLKAEGWAEGADTYKPGTPIKPGSFSWKLDEGTLANAIIDYEESHKREPEWDD